MGAARFKDYTFEKLDFAGTDTFMKAEDKEYLTWLFENQEYDEFFQFCLIKHYLVLFDNDRLSVCHNSEWNLLL